jgi:hypothetical protein
MNIMQQIASSCRAAIMTVILTNQTKTATTAAEVAHGFGATFTVAVLLVAVTLIPAFMLTGRKVEAPADAEQPASAAMTH